MKVAPHVYIAAADVCLPHQVEPDGTQGPRDSRALGMALHAARRTLRSAGLVPTDVDLLVHAWVHHQGEDNWAPPHRLAHRLGANTCQPVGVQQQCAGGAAAIDLAITRLLVDDRVRSALVVTSDDFATTVERYPAIRENSIADLASGATAVLLTRQPAQLAIVASAARGRPDAEPIHTAQRTQLNPVGSPAPMTLHQVTRAAKALQDAMLGALLDALTDADLTAEDPRIRHLMLSRIYRDAQETLLFPVLPDALRTKCRFLGEDTGHLGAGDTLANLHYLPGVSQRGDYTILLSGGMGLTANCLVVSAANFAVA